MFNIAKKVNVYLNFSIFTVFLKNRNIISKMKRSKVTDYAALTIFCTCALISRDSMMIFFKFMRKHCCLQKCATRDRGFAGSSLSRDTGFLYCVLEQDTIILLSTGSNTCPAMTEKLFTGTLDSNQTNYFGSTQETKHSWVVPLEGRGRAWVSAAPSQDNHKAAYI